MEQTKVTIRDKANASITVSSEITGVKVHIVIQIEDNEEVVSRIKEECEELESSHIKDFKYPPVEMF